MQMQELTIVYGLDTLSVEIALLNIQTLLVAGGTPLTGFKLHGEPMSFSDILPRLKKSKRNAFNITGDGFELDLSCIRNFQMDLLKVKGALQGVVSYKWIAPFLESSDFVMAWLVDAEYDFWQNAEDPLQYSARGKPFDHLPKRSNGLPPPLDQVVIDTSLNPGRCILRSGYYEAIGAVMWLGEHFWELTGARKEIVRSTPWLTASESGAALRVQAAESLFTTEYGLLGELQLRLRTLLYPT